MQEVPDERVAGLHKKADGQSEVEVDVALGTDLSLLDTAETFSETHLTLQNPFQCRGLLQFLLVLVFARACP